MNNLKRSILK